MRTSYQAEIHKRIKRLKTEVLLGDILEKPRGYALLIPLYEGEVIKNKLFNRVDQLVNKKLSEKADIIEFTGKKNELFIVSIFNFIYEEILVFGLGKKHIFHPSTLQKSFADAIRYIASHGISSVSFPVDLDIIKINTSVPASYETIGKLLSEAFYLAHYSFDIYKSAEERKKKKEVGQIYFHINTPSQISQSKKSLQVFEKGMILGKIVSKGIYMTRDLVNEPASHLTPQTLVDLSSDIANASHGVITLTILNEEQCAKIGMGAFLGVAKGSNHKPQFIILKYKKLKVLNQAEGLNTKNKKDSADKKNKQMKKICLIGKSITFDSGGLSLKPSEAMETMKIDMAGGATVLGFFHILSLLDAKQVFSSPYEIYGILPACENMPSGKAMRPGDIVTALNGKTIEVANTDAEGRLTLADALSYAERYIKPDAIIDLATLTGAIMVALGDEIAGLFGNDKDFTARVCASAQSAGELIWEMPLHEEYLPRMKSTSADIKNVSSGRYGGAITAGLFLKEFVSRTTKWAHLDIAGSSYNEGDIKGMIDKGATGWGVKTLVKLCMME